MLTLDLLKRCFVFTYILRLGVAFQPPNSLFLVVKGLKFQTRKEDSGTYFCLLKVTFLTDSTMVNHHEKTSFGKYVFVFATTLSKSNYWVLPSDVFDKPNGGHLTPEMVT